MGPPAEHSVSDGHVGSRANRKRWTIDGRSEAANPFSDACLIAMDYGRDKIIKEDWKSIFDDDQLDYVLKQMLHLDDIHR
jgi:hypothetical protein